MWRKLKRKLIYRLGILPPVELSPRLKLKALLLSFLKAKSFIIIEQFTNVVADYILHSY